MEKRDKSHQVQQIARSPSPTKYEAPEITDNTDKDDDKKPVITEPI